MDLLNQKGLLLAICLTGAALLLAADEGESDKDRPSSQLGTDESLEVKSELTNVKIEQPAEQAQDTTQRNQATDLKPLELRERIRAHANIDLPQDI